MRQLIELPTMSVNPPDPLPVTRLMAYTLAEWRQCGVVVDGKAPGSLYSAHRSPNILFVISASVLFLLFVSIS